MASCNETNLCIPIEKFCNKVPDCPDKSDEGSFCRKYLIFLGSTYLFFEWVRIIFFVINIGRNFSNKLHCSHGFKPVFEESLCYCPLGQQPEKNSCVGMCFHYTVSIAPQVLKHFDFTIDRTRKWFINYWVFVGKGNIHWNWCAFNYCVQVSVSAMSEIPALKDFIIFEFGFIILSNLLA